MTLPVRIARTPLDLLQYLTTLEPHPQMTEVALCAFHAALGEAEENDEARENRETEPEIIPPEGEDHA